MVVVLFKTRTGRIVDEHELNSMSALEIEEQGIHAADHWCFWWDEA
ncbi:hypothetical protein GF367_02560 [Candidatus Woesearchaeota archaeon]|nr:hypothetical protein [Candidatus Woesearchaeota archaeon]